MVRVNLEQHAAAESKYDNQPVLAGIDQWSRETGLQKHIRERFFEDDFDGWLCLFECSGTICNPPLQPPNRPAMVQPAPCHFATVVYQQQVSEHFGDHCSVMRSDEVNDGPLGFHNSIGPKSGLLPHPPPWMRISWLNSSAASSNPEDLPRSMPHSGRNEQAHMELGHLFSGSVTDDFSNGFGQEDFGSTAKRHQSRSQHDLLQLKKFQFKKWKDWKGKQGHKSFIMAKQLPLLVEPNALEVKPCPPPLLENSCTSEPQKPVAVQDVRDPLALFTDAMRRHRAVSPTCAIPQTESWDDEADDRTIDFSRAPPWLLQNAPSSKASSKISHQAAQPSFERNQSEQASTSWDLLPQRPFGENHNVDDGTTGGRIWNGSLWVKSPENSLSNDSWDHELGLQPNEPHRLADGQDGPSGPNFGAHVRRLVDNGNLGPQQVAVAAEEDEVPVNFRRSRFCTGGDGDDDSDEEDDGAPTDDLVYLHPPPDDPKDLLADYGPGPLPLLEGDAPANRPDPTRRRIYNGPLPEGLLPALSPHNFTWSPVEGWRPKKVFKPHWAPPVKRSHLVRVHHESPSFKILRYESPDDSNSEGYCEAVPS